MNMTRIHNATLKVIGGGRVTIPSEIRELENIKDGSFVKISIEKIDATSKAENSRVNNRKKSLG